MNEKSYYMRLALYAFIAICTSLVTDLKELIDSDPIGGLAWTVIILQALAAAGVTVRAFIDKSPSQIEHE